MRTNEEILGMFHQAWLKNHQITCPYCHEVMDSETESFYTSMFGENREQECCCYNCDRTFLVDESVDRTWEVKEKS